jgi:hypothetical protein
VGCKEYDPGDVERDSLIQSEGELEHGTRVSKNL